MKGIMMLMMTMWQVSFMKGDSMVLYSQASSDWWRGCVGGREGLIPDKYILIKIRSVCRLVSKNISLTLTLKIFDWPITYFPCSRGEDDPRDSMSSMSEAGSEPRRRISSQSTDTMRSTRSSGGHSVSETAASASSPRVSRGHGPGPDPGTPPTLARAAAGPARHTVSPVSDRKRLLMNR